jgi:hypothetical protein
MEDFEVLVEYEGYEIEEAKLTYAKRQNLPASAFCGPDRSYPAHDAAHVRNALARLHFVKNAAIKARIMGCLRRRAKKFGVEINESELPEEKEDKALEWLFQEYNVSESKAKVIAPNDAVIEWYLEEAGMNAKLVHVDPNMLHFSEKFDGAKHDRLYKRAKDFLKMKKRGETIPPIVLYENPDGTYEIHDGHARTVAFRRMGMRNVPAVVIPRKGNPAASSVPSKMSGSSSSSSSSKPSSSSESSESSESSKSSKLSSSSSSSEPSSSSKPSSSSESSKPSSSSSSSNSESSGMTR